MQLEDYFNFLGPNTIRLKGHSLGNEDILELYDADYSPEQIALEFPGLSLEHIHAIITCLHLNPSPTIPPTKW